MGLGDSPRGVGRARTESCQVKLQQTLPLMECLLLQQTREKTDRLISLCYGCLPSPRNQKKIKTSYSHYKPHVEGLHSMWGMPKPWDWPLSAVFCWDRPFTGAGWTRPILWERLHLVSVTLLGTTGATSPNAIRPSRICPIRNTFWIPWKSSAFLLSRWQHGFFPPLIQLESSLVLWAINPATWDLLCSTSSAHMPRSLTRLIQCYPQPAVR